MKGSATPPLALAKSGEFVILLAKEVMVVMAGWSASTPPIRDAAVLGESVKYDTDIGLAALKRTMALLDSLKPRPAAESSAQAGDTP